MRKHFLLLFLMALLPLAGWAEDIEVKVFGGQMDFTYGEITVPVGVSADMLSFIPSTLSDDAKNAVVAKLQYSSDLEEGSDAGTYNFQVSLISAGDRTIDDLGDGNTYIITVQDPTGSFIVGNATAPIPTEAPAFVTGDLSYNGNPIDLLTTKGTAPEGFELEYSLDNTEWSDNAYMVTNANPTTGYTVYYRTKAKQNYNASASNNITSKVVSKGTPTISIPTLVSSPLTYTGLAQAVINNAGSADFGTVKYLLQKKNGDSWNNEGTSNADYTTIKATTAGTYRVKAEVEGDGNIIEKFEVTDEFVVNKASLTISAQGYSIVYGNANPTPEAVYDGFVNGETADALVAAGTFTKPTVAIAAGPYNAGYYAITITHDATADNYEISYDDAAKYLLINPKPLTEDGVTVALDATNPVYDGSAKEANITSVSFNGGVRTQYNAETGVGDYAVSYDGTSNINAGTNTANLIITGKNNYTGSVTKKFSIDKADIYIQPIAAQKDYSGDDPEFNYKLVNAGGTEVAGATLGGTVNIQRQSGENVGTYKIYFHAYTSPTPDNDNYDVKNTADDVNSYIALFTINAAVDNTLVLKFKDDATASKVYGDANPTWSMDNLEYVEGLIGDDDWNVVKDNIGTPVFAIASENVADNETNKVTVTGLGSPNYPTVTVMDFDFSITPKQIAVTVIDQTIAYGANLTQGNEDSIWTTTGLVTTGGANGDITDTKEGLGLTICTPNAISTYAASATPYANVIKAQITNTNYELDETNSTWGNLTVNASTNIVLTRVDKDHMASATIADQIATCDGNTGVNVIIKYDDEGFNTFNKNQWYIMVLPFETDAKQISDAFGYAIVDLLKKSNDDPTRTYFYLHMSADKIPANTPFLIKAWKDIDMYNTGVTFTNVTIEAPDEENGNLVSTDDAGNQLIGSYTGKNDFDGSNNNWWYSLSDGSLKHPSSTAYLRQLSGYMTTVSAAESHEFIIEEPNGNTTVIRGITVDSQSVNAEGWYNLRGMKLQGAPTEKGVYIQNGKKVIIK